MSEERHPDHESEQAYLHGARAALDAMLERTERAVEFTDQRVRDEDSVDTMKILDARHIGIFILMQKEN